MSVAFPIPRQTRRQDLVAAAAQTAFQPTDFKVYDPADVRVRVKGASGRFSTITSGFGVTLSGTAPAFPIVTFAAGRAANDVIRIEGARTPSRTTDVTLAGILRAAPMEVELDRIAVTQQELRRDVDDGLAGLDGLGVVVDQVNAAVGTATGAASSAAGSASSASGSAAVAIAAAAAAGNKLDKGQNLADLLNSSMARINLGLGSAATATAGTAANNVLQLDATGGATLTASPPTTASGHQLATMQALRGVLMYATPAMYGAVGGDVVDDRAAFQAALNALGAKASITRTQTLLVYDNHRISGPGYLNIPPYVSVVSLSRFQGADGRAMPQIRFDDPTGGIFMDQESGLAGIQVFGVDTATEACITYNGKFGIFNVRTINTPIGLRPTDFLGYAGSYIYIPPNNYTLTNGTYNNVQFQQGVGNDGTARLQVVVSGGKITAVNVFTGGKIGRACIMASLAANALYAGSPVMLNVFQIFTCNAGRSRIDGYFAASHLGTANRAAVDLDTGLDFGDFRDIHIWNGKIGNGSNLGTTGLRIGKFDGCSLVNPKVFGYTQAFEWSCPDQGFTSMGTCLGQEIDLCNLGHTFIGPQKIDMTGGYMQTVGTAINIDHPLLEIAINGPQTLCQLGNALVAANFAILTVAAVNFTRNNPNKDLYYITISGGTGRCEYMVSGNNCDGNSPFILVNGSAKRGTIGSNNWPGRKYPATDGGTPTAGYLKVQSGALVTVPPQFSGTFSGTADAGGQFVITHGLGYVPVSPQVNFSGSAGVYFIGNAISATSESITIQAFRMNQSSQTDNGKAAAGGTFSGNYLI